MRKPVIDDIEIVEPPVGELSKQRNSLKKTCLTGCGCVIFLVAVILVLIRLFIGSGPTTIKVLPNNFPDGIPVYEKDSIEAITSISGTYKNRSMEIAAFFPKVILSPLLLRLHPDTTASSSEGFIAANKDFWTLLTTPVGDARDTIQIEWINLDAEPSFVASYYKKELTKKGYTVSEILSVSGTYEITFDGEGGVGGALLSKGAEEERPGTDYASLTVNFPAGFQNPPKK